MMIQFEDIESDAARNHGGSLSLKAKLSTPKSDDMIMKLSDQECLSELSKVIFQVGFKWSLVEEKWPYFETAFNKFNLVMCRGLSDEQLDLMLKSGNLIKNWPKLLSIRANAEWLSSVSREYGSVAGYLVSIKADRYFETLLQMKSNGTRVGMKTAQLWLRRMGVDSFVLTKDVEIALKHYGVINKFPASNRDWIKLQRQLNIWMAEMGYKLTHISQILAMSVADR